jgi:hypothetical protein
VIPLGPFVAIADGVTPVTDQKEEMNHASTGILIAKNGGALAARTTLTEPVYDQFGYYKVNLDATDTATPGRLKVIYGSAAVVLPCEADFVVIPHELWDTLFVTQPAAAINKFFDTASPTAGDPWSTPLPGAYLATEAGGILSAIKTKTNTLGGAGAITWTYTVTDSVTALPIADVDIWVTTDIVGANIIASAKTSAAGVATFYLDAGTVYVWRQKSGYTFTNPDTEVVV